MMEVPVEKLFIGKCNVRREPSDITDLARSVEERGILEPLIARLSDGRYEIVAGGRRFEAAKAVGLKTVPVLVRELSDEEAVAVSLMENLQRGDLSFEEKMQGYMHLRRIYREREGTDRGSITWISKITGIPRRTVSSDFEAYEIAQRLKTVSGRERVPRKIEVSNGRVSAIIAETVLPKKHAVDLKEAFSLPEVQQKIPEEELDKKLLEVAEAIAPKPQSEARKILNQFKMYPEKPVEEIVRTVEAKSSGVMLEVYLKPKVARALEEAGRERGLTAEELVPIAVEEWLKQVGCLV